MQSRKRSGSGRTLFLDDDRSGIPGADADRQVVIGERRRGADRRVPSDRRKNSVEVTPALAEGGVRLVSDADQASTASRHYHFRSFHDRRNDTERRRPANPRWELLVDGVETPALPAPGQACLTREEVAVLLGQREDAAPRPLLTDRTRSTSADTDQHDIDLMV